VLFLVYPPKNEKEIVSLTRYYRDNTRSCVAVGLLTSWNALWDTTYHDSHKDLRMVTDLSATNSTVT
jgi:hypothetical protein